MAKETEEEKLIRIHGEDVELAPDDSEDEKLTEEDALAKGRAEGYDFVDYYGIDGDEDKVRYETFEDAEANADGKPVLQYRETIYPEVVPEEPVEEETQEVEE